MLSPAHALELAARHQRPALRDAIAHAAALGQPVGFLCRPGASGAEFEAVALDAARTCAVIDAAGRLRYVASGTPRTPAPVAPRVWSAPRRAARQALAAAAAAR